MQKFTLFHPGKRSTLAHPRLHFFFFRRIARRNRRQLQPFHGRTLADQFQVPHMEEPVAPVSPQQTGSVHGATDQALESELPQIMSKSPVLEHKQRCRQRGREQQRQHVGFAQERFYRYPELFPHMPW